MRLLFDIGNTHTRAALASKNRLARTKLFETKEWFNGKSANTINRLVSNRPIDAAFCASVVPSATIKAKKFTKKGGNEIHLLTHKNCGLKTKYPKPKTIGPDRLANAIGALGEFPPPLIVVDFGTALTFDVVDKKGIYVGGIICPGLSVMTEYLHEKTALLPKVKIKDTSKFIGKSTIQAMQIGAVHGYRGLISNIVTGLKKTLHAKEINVIATGGCARIISANLPEISAIRPLLTLEGLRLASERIN